MNLNEIISEIELWDDWRRKYKHFVQLFIQEAINKNSWTDWDPPVFQEYFEKSKNCVSSLTQGCFNNVEKERIKSEWNRIAPLLKQVAQSQDVLDLAAIEQVKTEILKLTDTRKEAAVHRLIAGLLPRLLTTIVTYDKLNTLKELLQSKCGVGIPDYEYTNWFKDSHRVLNIFKSALADYDEFDIITYPWQTLDFLQAKDYPMLPSQIDKSNISTLLKFKKQIILQGPPGTGKTRMAMELAREFIRPLSITKADIQRMVKPGMIVKGIYDNIPYKVHNVSDTVVTLQLENGSMQSKNFGLIVDAYRNLMQNRPLVGGDAYQAAIARYVMDHWEDTDQIKILQFHPSYSYEDFVRGIIAEPQGNTVAYKNVNKTFALFSKRAAENYYLSRSENNEIRAATWVADTFNDFREQIEEELQQKRQILLSGDISVFDIDQSCFRYGKDWDHPSRLNFTDFRKLIKAVLAGKISIGQLQIPKDISLHAHYRSTYYMALLRVFFEKYTYSAAPTAPPEQKNYVLIVDEINRANLSSVLGELIYALEYRGERVESMYEVEGSSELLLPPNLYIIGTMNTADRSVGHIDYAIRRRFGFVDIMPKDLTGEPGINFHKRLFEQVAALFETRLSPEFEKKDVQIGHSYFIDRSNIGGSMSMRLKYEIKPILREYVKDGILIGDSINVEIDNLTA